MPEIALPGCDMPPGLVEEVLVASRLGRGCRDDAACWREGLARAAAARDRFAASYDAHRSYVLVARGAARALGESALAPIREEYAALAAAHPDHPAYVHLRAQLELEGEAYQQELERIAVRFPDYPWTQLSLAFRARPEASPPVRVAARAGYERFSTLCPGRVTERAAALELLGERELWARDGAALRAAARDAGEIQSLLRLWGLDLRFAAEAEREAVRAGIATELSKLAESRERSADDLRLLLRGADLAGDDAAKRSLEDRLVAGEPCAEDSAAIRARRLDEDAATAGDGTAARAARRAAIDAALALCPRDELALRQRIDLLGETATANAEELFATLDRYLALPPRRVSAEGVAHFLAASYLDWDVRLDRVPELLREDRTRIDAALARAAGDPLAELGAQARRRENSRLAVRHALATGDPAAARRTLEELTAATAAAPGGGRDAPVPGAAIVPDERTLLDLLRAGLAIAERRPEEALALLSRLILDRVLGPYVEPTARAAWQAAHGDESGFEGWRESVAAGLPPGAWKIVDRELPATPLVSFSGGAFDWSAFRGRALLVVVWTGGCKPCGKLVEAANRVAAAVGERSDRAVFGIFADRTAGEVITFLSAHDAAFEVLLGGDALFDAGLEGVPASWIVDPRGRIVRERFGFEGDSADWARAALAELDAVAPEPAPPTAPAAP